MAITYRILKGSELTYAEMDENFETLDGRADDIEEKADFRMGGQNFLHIQDQKTQGTNGGTFTSGAWRTRDLNTVLTNTISGASLASNQITLPAGKYYVEASAPAYTVNLNTSRLQDIDSDTVLLSSQSSRARDNSTLSYAVYSNVWALLNGIIVLSITSALELQHQCSVTSSNTGFGLSSNFTTEVYSDIRIWRIGEYVA